MIEIMANAILDLIRSLVLFGAAAYAMLLLFLYFTQDGMLYLPDLPSRELEATPKEIGLEYREVRMETEDGETLHGWYVPADDARATLLFFHGNAGNISHRLTSLSQMNSLGLNVLIFDYRGYGKSSGKPSEEGLYRDGRAAWRYLAERLDTENGATILFGRSLGGGVATRLALEINPAGLVLESPFTSVPDMAADLYPMLPARWLSRNRFDNLKRIPELTERFSLDSELLDKNVSSLSGGEKQRIALIAAILLDRKVYLLDEATSALDKTHRRVVGDYFQGLSDVTLLAVSHDDEAFAFADRVVTLPGRNSEGAPQ